MVDGIQQINDLREKYLRFFESRGHLIHGSASVKSDDPTLMFTSAGMVQFKPYFLGATPKFAGHEGTWHRVTTAQKCLRINDVENVGVTLRHHSFFEMLGNFSFGDYFKSEASAWAWEFATSKEYLGLDPERLYVTVYQDDDEAYAIWRDEVGVPEARISRWGEGDNFWPANAVSKGPNGPCGPCSEVFYDRGPSFGTSDEAGPNTGSGDRYIEFWNLVFTQFDRRDGGHLEPLPQQNIDTGLGFERLVAIMTDKVDAYATELFQPTIRRVATLSGVPYRGAESVSHRVIADHVRAVTFAITDGVLPTNDGAGYVIKMLTRRASRHAWLLGLREPVLYSLVDQVVESMGEAYPEIRNGAERVQGIIQAEEEQFLHTLGAGIQRVGAILDDLDGTVLSGDVAFDLWQTYGFPLDLTREMAAERGLAVDAEGYEAARQHARELSRSGGAGRELFTVASDALGKVAERVGDTNFLGYEREEAQARVVALVTLGDDAHEQDSFPEGTLGTVVLDQTPFYPEGGGQVGDAGLLEWPGGKALVSSTTKSRHGLTLHHVRTLRGTLAEGQEVTARVDPARRETQKHHSATHLLHAALRSVLGTHVAQAGSLVAPDRLRFDFSHPHAVTAAEEAQVEELVNRWVQSDLAVDWRVVPIAEARTAGAMMLFGEKYGENVRMVRMGEVSTELCGGTHVGRTGQIGAFVILSEEAVSAGVRRIEARVGLSALRYMQEMRRTQALLAGLLGGKPTQLEERLVKLQADHKEAVKEAARLRDRLASAQTTAGAAGGEVKEAGGFKYLTALLEGLDVSALRNAADTLLARSGADVVVLGSGSALVAKASAAAVAKGANAGKLVRAAATSVGGSGGGRADMAQAGVKDAARLGEALAAVGGALAAGD